MKTFIFARPERIGPNHQKTPADNIRIDIMYCAGFYYWSFHGESSTNKIERSADSQGTVNAALEHLGAARLVADYYGWELVGPTS